jgi:hypothetical protein
MSNVGNTRKLFLDSRFKISGSDADFTLELPQDVHCTRTSSFVVASCSFANTFSTVTPYNGQLYWIERNQVAGQTLYFMTACIIPPGNYTGAEFAGVLKDGIAKSVSWKDVSVSYSDDGYFNIAVTNFPGNVFIDMIIPNYGEIDKYQSLLNCNDGSQHNPGLVPWFPGPKNLSINTILNMPQTYPNPVWNTNFQTGVADLAPVREIYLHSSLANNRTLHINGARDCIARIPIDVDFGQVVSYRYLGPTDAISCSDANFRTISFQLRDFSGNLSPTGSFVVIELAFLDTDPYTM